MTRKPHEHFKRTNSTSGMDSPLSFQIFVMTTVQCTRWLSVFTSSQFSFRLSLLNTQYSIRHLSAFISHFVYKVDCWNFVLFLHHGIRVELPSFVLFCISLVVFRASLHFAELRQLFSMPSKGFWGIVLINIIPKWGPSSSEFFVCHLGIDS